MKHNKTQSDPNSKHSGQSSSAAAAELNPSEINFVPSTDAVARKAYFAYLNEGSRPGREVQHWLAAEADLIAERNLTRVHGAHNPT
jgi:hypothetical protein